MTVHTHDAAFDAYAESYKDTVNRSIAIAGLDVDYFARVKVGYLHDAIAMHFRSTLQPAALDVGCGVGCSHALMRRGLGSLTGVDVSSTCIEKARSTNSDVDYHSYDGTALPFADASFDVATATCVMHHVPRDQWPSLLSQMKRVLRPGGLLAIFEHNPRNPLTRWTVSNCEFDEDAVLLGPSEMRRLVIQTGFRDTSTRTIISIPSLGRRTRRLDAALGKLGLGAQYLATATA